MNPFDRDKLLELCKKAKTVGGLTPDEQAFCQLMFDTYPNEYGQVSDEVTEWSQDYRNWMGR